MAIKATSKRRTGLNTLAYEGVEALTPPEFVIHPRVPTPIDSKNFNLGTIWLNSARMQTVPPQAPLSTDIWILVALIRGQATWVNFIGGLGILTLTGNAGGPVIPDGLNNINVVGDGITVTTTGNLVPNTLTISLLGAVAIQYDADLGFAIPVGNILNIFGGVGITTTGAGNTITIDVDAAIATTYTTDAGNAVPAGGILNVFGDGVATTTTGAGNTVTVTTTGAVATQYDGNIGTAIPLAGILNIIGDGLTATTNAAGNTVTISTLGGGGNLSQLTSDAGVAIQIAGNIDVLGNHGINTFAGAPLGVDQFRIAINNAIFLGDLVAIPGLNALTAASGNIEVVNGEVIVGNTAVAANGSFVRLEKSRGGGIITAGDTLGTITFSGHDGVQDLTAAAIQSVNSGTVAATRVAGDLSFLTRPNVLASPAVVRMNINPDGNVTINRPRVGAANPVGLSVLGAGIVGIYDSVGLDPYTYYEVNGGNSAAVGIDNSDGDRFKISSIVGIGANPSAAAEVVISPATSQINYPLQSSFFACKTANSLNQTGAGAAVTVIFNQELFDQNGDYNNVTGVFVAPQTGRYQFNLVISIRNIGAAHTNFVMFLRYNGVSVIRLTEGNPTNMATGGSLAMTSAGSVIYAMNAGDTMEGRIVVFNGAATITVQGLPLPNPVCHFSGQLLA